MKIALIGYGVMGQLVAAEAKRTNQEIGAIITSADSVLPTPELAERLRHHDVAIDFSIGEVVPRNIEACLIAAVPVVVGTTGWKEHEADVKRLVAEHNGAVVYGANFSIGVNIFYRIVKNAAALFSRIEGYSPFIEEAHHSRKRDAPSGTALRLSDLMSAELKVEIPTASTRAGHIPGTHRVGFDSEADQITLTHTARSRQGFAAGALFAANWIKGRQGIYEFGEVIDLLL